MARYPHTTVDPIVVAAQIILGLQTVVSRNVDPIQSAVITVGMIGAGEASNVIPDTAEMRLTIRSFDPGVRTSLHQRIGEIATGIAGAMGATAQVNYTLGYPSLINDPAMAELVLDVATEALGPDRVWTSVPMMGAEDFSYFLEQRPGCFFNVGTMNEEKGFVWGHHHPRFDMDEEGFAAGIEVMTRVVMRYLSDEL